MSLTSELCITRDARPTFLDHSPDPFLDHHFQVSMSRPRLSWCMHDSVSAATAAAPHDQPLPVQLTQLLQARRPTEEC